MNKPVVEIDIAEKDDALYIIFMIEDTEASSATLTVPIDWKIQESRGVHASDIATYEGLGRITHIIPFAADAGGKIELRFTATTPFDAIAFSHDAPSPALLTLTHIALPKETTTRNTRIVEGSAVVRL